MANSPFPGGPLTDQPIGETDNVLADFPVGGTSNDIVDSPRAGTSNILTDLDPVSVGAGYVALDGSEPGIVFGVNFNNEIVDVTGNHTLQTVTPTTFTAAKSYDGLRYMAQMPESGSGRIFTASGTAHQITTANPVSYGGMFFLPTVQPLLFPTLLFSGTTTGPTGGNYGLYVDAATDIFTRTPGTGEVFAGTVPYDDWKHIVVVENAGRTSATIYINGTAVDTQALATPGDASASDDVWIGEFAGVGNTGAAGWCSDVFISNLELTAPQVMTFATNAFGGTPP